MGKGVICSRLNAIRHYFSEEALAYFEPNNPQDLARQMARLYKNSEIPRRLAERAKLEYSPINWDVMKRRYLKLVGNLAGEARGSRAGIEAAVSVSGK
jgi:glycosyltransferase involved in cell wall biosynthesis